MDFDFCGSSESLVDEIYRADVEMGKNEIINYHCMHKGKYVTLRVFCYSFYNL